MFYILVKCYYELSKRLGYTLDHEENRIGFLSDEMKIMMKAHDEVAAISSDQGNLSAFDLILERATLAHCLKTVNKIKKICFLKIIL